MATTYKNNAPICLLSNVCARPLALFLYETLAIIMKNSLLILILAFTFSLQAQNLTKSDFKKTEWFVNNENQNFYESDYVTLIRILKFNNENDNLNEPYIKL